jgi:hypothetical protein
MATSTPARRRSACGSRIEDLTALEPPALLFCCQLVKQVAGTAKIGVAVAAGAALGR